MIHSVLCYHSINNVTMVYHWYQNNNKIIRNVIIAHVYMADCYWNS